MVSLDGNPAETKLTKRLGYKITRSPGTPYVGIKRIGTRHSGGSSDSERAAGGSFEEELVLPLVPRGPATGGGLTSIGIDGESTMRVHLSAWLDSMRRGREERVRRKMIGELIESSRIEMENIDADGGTPYLPAVCDGVIRDLHENEANTGGAEKKPPTAINGWLWKKGGGQTADGKKNSGSYGRHNWSRRYFKLVGHSVFYYKDPPKSPKDIFINSLYNGDLLTAKTNPDGSLAVSVVWDSARERHVLEIPFGDRSLLVGTDAGPKTQKEKKDDLAILQAWCSKLSAHHEYFSTLPSEDAAGNEEPDADPSEPQVTQGWLWKKAGGALTESAKKMSIGRTNWMARWFRLDGPYLSYFEDKPTKPGQALYRGDLSRAAVNAQGKLEVKTEWDSTRKRYIISIPFHDRILRIGSDEESSERVEVENVLASWAKSITLHHEYFVMRAKRKAERVAADVKKAVGGGSNQDPESTELINWRRLIGTQLIALRLQAATEVRLRQERLRLSTLGYPEIETEYKSRFPGRLSEVKSSWESPSKSTIFDSNRLTLSEEPPPSWEPVPEEILELSLRQSVLQEEGDIPEEDQDAYGLMAVQPGLVEEGESPVQDQDPSLSGGALDALEGVKDDPRQIGFSTKEGLTEAEIGVQPGAAPEEEKEEEIEEERRARQLEEMLVAQEAAMAAQREEVAALRERAIQAKQKAKRDREKMLASEAAAASAAVDSEAKATATDAFSAIDLDGDGLITREEWAAAHNAALEAGELVIPSPQAEEMTLVPTPSPPTPMSGWLWKKAGGGKKESFSLAGRNWNRRWFTLDNGLFSYFEDPAEGGLKRHAGFTKGAGKPIWSGDLRTAPSQVNEDGSLKSETVWDDAKKRTILQIGFKNRVLTMGSSSTQTEKAKREEAAVLRTWEESIQAHHRWLNRDKIKKETSKQQQQQETQRPRAAVVKDGKIVAGDAPTHLKKD